MKQLSINHKRLFPGFILKGGFQIFLMALLMGLALIPLQPSLAAPLRSTVSVNTTADDLTNNGNCSLREAIKAANTDSAVDACSAGSGADTINLPAGTYTLTLTNAGGINEDADATGDLDVLNSLTIQGAGSGSTIIQAGTNSSNGIDKVLALNPLCDHLVNVSIDGVTIRYGRNTQSAGASDYSFTGGGLDWCGYGTGTFSLTNSIVSDNTNVNGYGGGVNLDSGGGYTGSTTISNVTFDNNQTNGATGGTSTGGAINIFDASNVTISNSTFTNNKTLPTTAGGGAVYYRPTGAGSLTIHNSDFNGNTSGGQGGAIYTNIPSAAAAGDTITIDQGTQIRNNVSGGVSGGTAGGNGLYLGGGALTTTPILISKVTISGNSEGGSATAHNGGGGIFVENANLTLQYSRIVNNTISGGASGSGLYKNIDTGAVTATNNWWGCSTGPSATPCNTAVIVGGSAGSLSFTPYFRVLTTPGSSTIVTNQTTSLLASVNTNSAGSDFSANVDRMLGLGVTWSATNGSISGADATISSSGGTKGTASATFTATAAGAGKGIAKVDNDNTTGSSSNIASITINKANTTAAITGDTPDPSVTNQSVTVSYSVTGAFGNSPTAPTGNVVVSDGTDSCTGTVSTGSCTLKFSSAGSKTITATYQGDSNFNASPASSGVAHTVDKADTTAAITSDSPDPSITNQAVTVNYSVTGAYGNSPTAPSGNVLVSDGTDSCTGTVAAGTCNITLTTPGLRTLTATYQGDSNFNASPASAGASHSVRPIVTNVTSSTANGAYTNPTLISIQVTFNEAVTVTGTPQLALNSGGTASYASGSGTATLTFDYTIQDGDNSSDLDYSSTSALTLNGGTIKDGDTIDASLTLASPGAAGSLGANKAIVVDTTEPTVTNVSSNSTSGCLGTSPKYCNVGDSVSIQIAFSEAVDVTGTPQLTLNSGGTAGYVSGSGTSTLTFTYTVGAGENTSDLDYSSPSALSLNGGSIQDVATNAATLTLPIPSAPGSLGANANIVVDTTAPTVTIEQASGQFDPTNAGPINFTVTFSEAVSGFATGDVGLTGTAGATTGTVTGGPAVYNVAVSGMTGDGTVIASIAASKAQDLAGNDNAASTSSDNSVTYDTTAPTVTIEQASGQADPTGSSPINFTVTFSEAVTGFVTGDVSLSGTAGATTDLVSGGPTVYSVAVSGMTGDGTVIASIAASKAQDLAGNNNTASTSTDNSVIYDGTVPTVTINQASGQSDPAGSSPINFTVTFSEPVSGFATGDVDLSASTTSGTLVGTVSGGPTVYNVAVSGMTSDGTVVASVPAGVATDGVNPSAASTSTDNSVLYDTAPPSVTIDQAGTQVDPTNAGPINFTVTFSENVTGFATGDVDLSASTAPGSLVGTVTGGPKIYTVAVSGMSGDGAVIATVPASVATDLASHPNGASTSTDNSVTYDTTAPNTIIDTNPSNPTNSASASFTFHGTDANGVASFECQLDSGGYGACSSPKSYSGLSDGSHTFDVRAIDNAGNTDASPASYTWTVDTIAPDTTINTNPSNPTSSIGATFTFSGTDGSGTGVASFECQLDGGGYGACSSPKSYSGLSDGSHTFDVRAIDAVNNADASPASYTWVVDTTAPDTSITANPSNPTNSTSASFSFNGSDTGGSGVASFECQLDSGGYSACTSPKSYAGLSAGSHTFYVRAIDNAANIDASPASFTWLIDTTAPTVTINQASSQSDPSGSSPINFTVVFSEAVTGFATGDVSLSGAAGATTGTVTQIAPNDGTTYNVAVSGMTGGGTVIADIAASKAQDLAGNNNAASTSSDNTVTFTVNTTTTIISDTPDPSTAGQAVTVNFTVVAALGSNPSAGNVTVTDSGGATPCVGAVTAGAGSCNITLTGSGAHTLTATYAGSGLFNGSSDTESHSVSVTITVNTFTDDLTNNGNCSLREAIRAANTNAAVDACPAGSASITDVISLATGTYALSRVGTDDTALLGDLDITGDTRIIGAGAANTFVTGGTSQDRVFHILSGTVEIDNLTVKLGKNALGAGIYNAGFLTLNSVTVTSNASTTATSGISSGAGIYNSGTLTLNNSTVSSNTATSGASGKSRGGGIYNGGGTVTLNSCTVTGNKAISGALGISQGGGIYTTGGSTTLNSTTPSGNTVTTGAGGTSAGPNTYP